MAPGKFGLFKSRSKEQQELPSTENLLQNTGSTDTMARASPVASTSRNNDEDNIVQIEMDILSLDGGDTTVKSCQKATPTRRLSHSSKDDSQIHYQQLKNAPSTDITSTTTVQDQEDFDEIISLNDLEHSRTEHDANIKLDDDDHHTNNCDDENDDQNGDVDDASTSCDASSVQFDEITSIAPSEDISIHCGAMRKPKKSRSREEKQMSDFDMWQASNVEVMQNLLTRSGTINEQYKWEAIAMARGLCTLTDSCACGDCRQAKYLAGVADGDGGLGAAPLFNAITLGCCVQ